MDSWKRSWKLLYSIQGLYRDNAKKMETTTVENGNYYVGITASSTVLVIFAVVMYCEASEEWLSSKVSTCSSEGCTFVMRKILDSGHRNSVEPISDVRHILAKTWCDLTATALAATIAPSWYLVVSLPHTSSVKTLNALHPKP